MPAQPTRTCPPLTRFWLTLERLPGPAAVAAEWRRWLGDDFGRVRALLRPADVRAEAYPHPGGGEPYRVVEHGPDEFVGVRGDGVDRVALTPADLVVYRLDPARLARAVAAAFAVDPDGTPMDGVRRTYRVGLYRPLAGYEYAVFLTIQSDRAHFQAAVDAVLARVSSPFILLAPTTTHHRTAGRLLLDGRTAAFIPLADAIVPGPGGGWALSEAGNQLLNEFRSRWSGR